MARKRKPPQSNREAVARHLVAIRRAQPVDTHGEALCQIALALADQIDAAPKGTPAVSGWARELRLTLAEIGLSETGDDDELDDDEAEAREDEESAWLDALPAPFRHAAG